MRVARIDQCEQVEGKKLLKLTLDDGSGKPRTVFSGIRGIYEPDQLVGRLCIVLANLKPRKMKFGLSEGMVLAAGEGQDLFLLDVDSQANRECASANASGALVPCIETHHLCYHKVDAARHCLVTSMKSMTRFDGMDLDIGRHGTGQQLCVGAVPWPVPVHGVSTKVDSAIGMSFATTFVLTLSSAVAYLIYLFAGSAGR